MLAKFLGTCAVAAGARLHPGGHPLGNGYSVLSHALLLEGLAVRAASRETVATALEGLVDLAGGAADWAHTNPDVVACDAAVLRERWAGQQRLMHAC